MKFLRLLIFLLNIFILKVGFLISWVPYAFVALYSAFINPEHISEFDATLPAMFAKSAALWPSVLYSYANKNIRRAAKSALGMHQEKSSTQYELKSLRGQFQFNIT